MLSVHCTGSNEENNDYIIFILNGSISSLHIMVV
ncbi:hypothetical protein F383_26100 [Gossypium arboreum]|uniref:Uncharacterized protein n=1 Tax=Gossypium arboreum TaxID=29729 RepID=A0A0B0P553_GOSAR|nr:hypothetical protein F383_26100 [Gossypium arboreum]